MMKINVFECNYTSPTSYEEAIMRIEYIMIKMTDLQESIYNIGVCIEMCYI